MNKLILTICILFSMTSIACRKSNSVDHRLSFESSKTQFNTLYSENDIVFFGKVVELEYKPATDFNGMFLYFYKVSKVAVLDLYKDNKLSPVIRYWRQTSCLSHIDLELNKDYFFFGNRNENGEVRYVEVWDYLEYLGRGAFQDLSPPIKHYDLN